MRIFKSRKKTLEDPIFGSMSYVRNDWHGNVKIAGEPKPVFVWVTADRAGPTPEHHHAFQALEALLPDVSVEIAEALYALYKPYLSLSDFEAPRPDSPESLRKMLALDAIAVSTSNPQRLFYGFCGDAWPDASFSLEVDGGKIRPISLDD